MIPTGPITNQEVRDLMKIGLKSDAELNPDFKTSGGVGANCLTGTDTHRTGHGRDDSDSSAMAVDRNPSCGSSAPPAQPFSDTPVATDGLSDVFADITRRFLRTK